MLLQDGHSPEDAMRIGKYANLSLHGWTEASATQVIALGQSAHIGIQDAPAGADVTLRPGDPTICVVHEEPANKMHPRWRHFLITALRDGETKLTAIAQSIGSTTIGGTMTVKVAGHAGVRLIFFPGERMSGSTREGTIYVIGGKGESMKAAGGEAIGRADRGGHTVEPTPAGDYVLGPRVHVVAPSWPKSVIPWGAALRLNAGGEAEFEDPPGRWRLATGPTGEVTAAALAFFRREKPKIKPKLDSVVIQVRSIFIDPTTKKLRDTTWKLNDFGRWGWNLRLNGHRTAYYVHTTPEDEQATAASKAVHLCNSHGCIHLPPSDRDRFMREGYLKEGVHLEVRRYSETGPP
jgi:L,D-transpeptidase-like protein